MRTHRNAVIAALVPVVLETLRALCIKRRGFRASSSPSAIEVRVARSIRSFAIPSDERKRANPLAHNDVALEQGREHYLARCAACHGVDGRGSTLIGANEYPRVPDLHSDLTQRLSDGELHYLIANGVQLTGMPAMQGTNSETNAESWKLVSYIRSFRSPTRQEAVLQKSADLRSGRKRIRRVAKRGAGGENLTPDDAHAVMERRRFSGGLSIETLSTVSQRCFVWWRR